MDPPAAVATAPPPTALETAPPAAGAPPPIPVTSSSWNFKTVKPLPIAYTRHRDGEFYRTPSKGIRTMYPVMGSYLDRPTKIPVTGEIKSKDVKLIDAHGTILTGNLYLKVLK